MTFVDRATRCILAWRVTWYRTCYLRASRVGRYYSDDFSAYKTALYWPATCAPVVWGIHHPMQNKSRTYSVEGRNADIRHYLARLARRARCFSRCENALRRAVRLFVFVYNHRQLEPVMNFM